MMEAQGEQWLQSLAFLVDDKVGRNILKQRKLEREAELKRVDEPARADSPQRMPAPPSPPVNVKPMHAPARNTRVTDMESYKARWRVSSSPVVRLVSSSNAIQ